MAVTPIRRQPSLADQVHQALRESIIAGRIAPGGRLVVEHLAEELGVSPTPVREALARLIQKGLVEEAGAGRFQVVNLTPAYVAETFLVRSALEGLAAELAAPRLAEAQLAELEQRLNAASAALEHGDYEVHVAADSFLHDLVLSATASAVLQRELQSLRLHIDYIRGYSRRRAGEHIRLSHQEHVALLDAFQRRDAEEARRRMESHIRQAGERIARLIDFEEVGNPAAAGA